MTWPSRPAGPAEDEDPTGVRALLAALPDPGPMPDEVAARVLARLADAQVAMPHDGAQGDGVLGDGAQGDGLASDGFAVPAIAGIAPAQPQSEAGESHATELDALAAEDTDDRPQQDWGLAALPFDNVEALPPTRHPRAAGRRPRWMLVAGAAAGVGLVLVGASTVYRNVTNAERSQAAAERQASGMAVQQGDGQIIGGVAVHVQMSGRAYSEVALSVQAQDILESPSAEVVLPVSNATSIGPVATPEGLTSCIDTLGEDDADQVGVDMATYAGQSAAVIVIVRNGTKQVFAVAPACTQGDPQILAGPLPMT